ncbi:zonular occludens toxin domain-containing protein [Burkholderia sp. MSMB1498]|uniref:zonular occludens toxin domain-containing protein n=1 Tax=Burkholderia sp. MSMB1498 TaxID=1637842 RepID=UPI000754DFC5|nr:zonular occludens toxin domain-containing protein [Burkholderia sp. MSMB1498]KVK92105.1 Zonular occludens toxin [Burkholderia sp. MSMB1498]
MAINAYCGIMGSGKSYEVVSGPVLDAIARGRRVVTNIDGINEEAVHDYLIEKRGLDREKLGRVVHVTTDRVQESGFFPVEIEGADGATVTPGLVEPGDLLAIDEAWKLWAFGEKLSKEHVAFFRMHRHFVNPDTGLACDVVLMVQSVGDLHRMLRPVLELTFVMHKLKAFGAPSRYRVEQYDGWKQNAKTRVATYYKAYKAEIFPLYKSYAGGAGQEAVVDARQNVLLDRKLWWIAGAVVVLIGGGLWLAVGFFTRKTEKSVEGRAAVASPTPGGGLGVSGGVMSVPVPAAAPNPPDVSDTWRVVGRFQSGDVHYVVLADSSGRLRVDSPSAFNGAGAATVGRVDGQRVATWSGSKPSSWSSFVPGGNAK